MLKYANASQVTTLSREIRICKKKLCLIYRLRFHIHVQSAEGEHHYQIFLRITELCEFGAVCRTLRERVHASLRSYRWNAVLCEGVDPAPLTCIAKFRVNLRSLRLVCRVGSYKPMLYRPPLNRFFLGMWGRGSSEKLSEFLVWGPKNSLSY